MPNALAYLMLALWPLASLAMFRRLPLEKALIWTILGGYLLLPPIAAMDLPLVPPMDKFSIPTLSAALICLFVLRLRLSLWPANRLARLLVLGFFLGAIPTVLTNRDPILFETLAGTDPIQFVTGSLPGLTLRDTLSALIGQALVLLPFLMARQFLASEDGLRALLVALVVAGLAYSIPALIEIRLSPQINVWVYGFFQQSFLQAIRNGGYRPVVFLPHGLWLALFVLTTAMAATALFRVSEGAARRRYMLAAGYLVLLLWLCKSLGAFAMGMVLLPLLLFAGPRTQIRVAVCLALVATVYPMLRNAHLIPLDAIMEQAESVSADRAQSLGFRFENEELLLERAAEKPWFGWGLWGRNLTHDPETGQITTVPDGQWIIVFGTFGWLGYICTFGLLALPVLLTARRMWRHGADAVSPFVLPLVLTLTATMMDMLLNATLIPFTWLTAGAILGHLEDSRARSPARALFGGTQAMTAAAPAKGPRTIL
ncbi:hypothetical protein [Oceaniglobus roseus]|uniref:hypothetical protein n=1 Tax=Oceaniglobus roseus TaxID=1737570 RepID=UPI000C7EF23F|nr:hypothetical protein [Kandeliimicrobium roseum]